MSKIWVFVEQRHGHVAEVGLELLAKGVELGASTQWSVAAILVGHEVGGLTDLLLSYGVEEVLVADHPLLAEYCNEAYVKALTPTLQDCNPEVVLLGATAMGTDLAPRLAARLRTGLSAHCIGLDLTPDGQLLSVVPGWGGNLMARISCPKTRPQIATVKPGVFPMIEPGAGRGHVIHMEVNLTDEDITYRVLETEKEEIAKSGLETAEVVVAGGWGVGSKSDWQVIQDLAGVLNGAVGATRPPVDEGWAEEKQMIGQSGVTVHPKLYIGVGISGHMHHLVGLKATDLKVAINSDPDAPIFEYCDLGLVGDFKEIVPELTEAIKAHS